MQKLNLFLKSLLLIILMAIVSTTNAQTGLNFQGVARSNNNVILASQAITIRLSILQGSANGNVEYTETRRVTTNAQGLFNSVIGSSGALTTVGNFANINWSLTPKFLRIEMDPAAGSNFIVMGTTQIETVPYAEFAKTVNASGITGILPVTLGGTGVNSLNGLKTALSLDNVSNTSDLNKPVSSAVQAALNLKENSSNKSTSVTLGTSDELFPTQKAVKAYVDAQVSTVTIPDANATTRGRIQLAGDLGGTASLPTVPGLALKANLASPTFTGTVNGITKAMVGLGNADNTSDINKPISAIQQTALDAKSPLVSPAFTGVPTAPTATSGTNTTQIATTAFVISTNAINANLTGDVTSEGNATTVKSINGVSLSGLASGLLKNTTTTGVPSIAIPGTDYLTPTGNAATATRLATARNINGVAFDGTANVTIAADASTLTGNLLNSTVTGSSLTSLGTLTNLTISNKAIVGTSSSSVSSAILETNSTTQGLLPPRMTYRQRMLISSPVAGLTIWCSNCGTSGQMQVYNGTLWTDMVGGTSLTANPEITTTTPKNITSTSATSGGEITSDGGNTITARGIVWGTSNNPTISLTTKTTLSGTTGIFTSNMTGLTINTQYYVRAYATTSLGTTYGSQNAFTTIGLPVVASTTTVSSITGTTATSGGNITSDGGGAITARGVVWSTTTNPTIALSTRTTDAGNTGTFTSNLTGLTAGTLYYVRAYATNNGGTSYGPEVTFSTRSLPIVSTSSVTNITSSTATSGGNLTNDGGSTITEKGVCWSTSPNPTIADSRTNNGVTAGTYTSNLTGLLPLTLYYVRAYATNTAGTAYGPQVSFTTLSTPPADVTSTTGKIWLDRNLGASRVATSATDASAFGDLYQWGRGTDGHQSRTSTKTNGIVTTNTPGDALFIFSSSFYLFDWRSPQNDGLWQGVNGVNNPCPTGYRLPTDAEWTAEIATWSSSNSAGAFASPLKLTNTLFRDYGNGNIPATVIGDPGYYWTSTISAPDATFTGKNARYLFFNTARAEIQSFPRAAGLAVRCIKDYIANPPTVAATTAATNVTATSATSGGNVTNDGGGVITARGVVWSTTTNPTITLSTKTTDAGTTGTFTSTLTGLTGGTQYFVRAYATNSGGTTYGTQITFTTLDANSVVTGTGRTWMDRNLGATLVATSQFDVNALGDLYQWGRRTDGHEKRTSSTTVIQSSGDVPGNALFIRGGSSGNFDNPYDWRVTPNNNLWQSTGINNPCPVGFRIPTQAEWVAEIATWGTSRNAQGAFASPLKLTIGGFRDSQVGSINNVATTSTDGIGFYWSNANSTSAPGVSMALQLRPKQQPNNPADVGQAEMVGYARAHGMSVRCIKD
jgi:uncharacterized protein (TIGR02145 family)